MILSVNHLLSKIKRACRYSKDSITISIINHVTVIAPAFFIVINSFVNKIKPNTSSKSVTNWREKNLKFIPAQIYASCN